MKNLFNLYFFFNLVFGLGFIESPQNSINLARWNGGSASSNIYHQLNPAALPIFNVVSFSNITLPISTAESAIKQSPLMVILSLSSRYFIYITI